METIKWAVNHMPVSYTHLDVYKRQVVVFPPAPVMDKIGETLLSKWRASR